MLFDSVAALSDVKHLYFQSIIPQIQSPVPRMHATTAQKMPEDGRMQKLWHDMDRLFDSGALCCCGQHVMLYTCLPTNLGLITIARLASQTRTEITCRPSVPPSAPYDDVAAVPTSSSSSSSSSLFPPSARTCCRRRRRRTCAVLANGGVAVVAERPMGARLGPKMKAVA